MYNRQFTNKTVILLKYCKVNVTMTLMFFPLVFLFSVFMLKLTYYAMKQLCK